MTSEIVETELLKDLTLAQDAANNAAITRAELDLQDFYERQGCISPDAALLASLLINPKALEKTRGILPRPGIFSDAQDQQLYTAMLRYPCSGGLAQWWNVLSGASGLSLPVVLAYLNYDFYNCQQCEVYALLLLLDAARRRVTQITNDLMKQFYDGHPIAAIDATTRDLTALRQRLMEVV